jgi:hypothetical protein
MEYNKENYFIPYPLEQLKSRLRKKHDVTWKKVDVLIKDYVKTDGSGYLNLNRLLFKKMNSNISLKELTKEEQEEFEIELNKLDVRFEPILFLIEKMSANEKRKLFLEMLEDGINFIGKQKKEIRKFVVEKKEWSDLDSLIYSYLEYLLSAVKLFVAIMDEVEEKKVDKTFQFLGINLTIYGTVIVGYFDGLLERDVLIRRMSELSVFTTPPQRRQSKVIKSLISGLIEVMPCPES